MIRVDNLSFSPDYNNDTIINKISSVLHVKPNEILSYTIVKKSIDARRKPDVKIMLTLAVELKSYNNVKGYDNIELDYTGLKYENCEREIRPVVVGFGPAGMFCALALSYMGYKPIVIEQGMDVDNREKEVEKFWQTGVINPLSNVQFGEGGAGTFSDGKLNTNLNNKYCKMVINEFYKHGAPKEILYINKPHIGSDNLKTVVKNIRKSIIDMG